MAERTYYVVFHDGTQMAVSGVNSVVKTDVTFFDATQWRNLLNASDIGRAWDDIPTPGEYEGNDDRVQDTPVEPRHLEKKATLVTFYSGTAGGGDVLFEAWRHDILGYGTGEPSLVE